MGGRRPRDDGREESLAVVAESLGALDETVEATSEAVGRTIAALDGVEGAMSASSSTLHDVRTVLTEMASVVGVDIAVSIESLGEVLPVATEAGDLVDASLGVLSGIGLIPSPDGSLGDAFLSIEESVAGSRLGSGSRRA